MPPRVAPFLSGLILSGLMSPTVSGFATFRKPGIVHDLVRSRVSSWLLSWSIAFPVLLVVAPLNRWLVGMLVKLPACGLR
jgi:hypothetical protein